MTKDYIRLERSQLETTLDAGPPENGNPAEGVALVNVLDTDQFREEHIPGSINIPADDIDEFERRFAKDKKIVVYCASRDCPASREAAEALVQRGFEHVFDYEGGLSEWKDAGRDVERGQPA
jgi:rhodanese-related sulfurtransferase